MLCPINSYLHIIIPPTLLSSAFSQSILIKHIYRHPMREAELQAAREGRSVDNVEVDEEKAREDFLVFFEYVFTLLYYIER